MTWWDTHQVSLYVLALIFGALAGLVAPSVAEPAESLINPSLALLLYATFLGIPLTRLMVAFRDRRFLLAVLVGNFLLVPPVVFLLTRPIADDRVLLVGASLVLLAPCIDYVIAFTGLAGGARVQLLAATPLLLVGQILLLPLLLRFFVGVDEVLPAGPFLEAFLLLILLPLGLALLLQRLMPRHGWARRIDTAGSAAMVPLMMATLFVVLAGHSGGVLEEWQRLLLPAGVYLLFALTMILTGLALSSLLRLPVPQRVAATFSGVTRNSLVVLPFALAMGDSLPSVVVVTQTMVELVIMVAMVAAMPRIARKIVG